MHISILVTDDSTLEGYLALLDKTLLVLLDNAATHPRESQKIQTSTSRETIRICMSVSNVFKAIPEEGIAYLICPSSNERNRRSFALVLAITHLIAEKHAGTITCESMANDETTFAISIFI